MTRAISTVADVTFFLLFVGAAAAALVHASALDPAATENPATEETELLATSTASVEYALDPPVDPPAWTTNASARHQRTAHGTLAELLGEAAMSGLTVDGTRLSTAGTGFEDAVANATRARLREPTQRHAVRVRWEPYRAAPLNATMRVGERPPPSADVSTSTMTVPSPTASVGSAAETAAAEDGYEGVATVVADAVVEGLFPPEQAQLALDSDYPEAHLMSRRYERMAALTDAGNLSPDSTSARTMNADLTTALVDRFEADMRRRFDSPAAAADAVETGEITITVRTWSP
jgi:hypothetical protein